MKTIIVDYPILDDTVARELAKEVHFSLFEDNENVVVDLTQAGTVIASAFSLTIGYLVRFCTDEQFKRIEWVASPHVRELIPKLIKFHDDWNREHGYK